MVLEAYSSTFCAVYVLLLSIFIQTGVSAVTHARQPNAIPGVDNHPLDPSSFAFRVHRTFMNSLENVPFMMGLIFLAVLIGVNTTFLSGVAWVYTLSRVIFMGIYYAIATRKNPSLRSYFFMIGILSQLTLFAGVGYTLLNLLTIP